MHHVPLVKPDGTVAQFIFTASSDGRLHAYDITSVGCAPAADGTAAVVEASLQHDTKGSRLTCLSVTGYLTGQAPALGDEDASSSDDDDTSSDDDDSSNADSEDVELLDSDEEDTEEAEWQGLA